MHTYINLCNSTLSVAQEPNVSVLAIIFKRYSENDTGNMLVIFYLILDATITWTAPPPQRGPLQTSDLTVRRTTQQLVINSPEGRLKWEFTLSGETLDRVIWERGNNRIGRKTSSGVIVIEPTANFQEHFGVSSDDPATLIIKNVTEADAAVFRCSVETNVKTWADEIQVEIVGEWYFTCVRFT